MPTRRELRGRLLRMMRAKNPLALYKRFLADTGQSALFKAPAKGVVEWEDAFPVVLCALAFARPRRIRPHFCRAPSGHRRDAGSDAGAARGHLPPVPLRSHYPGGCEPARGRPCGVGARGGGGPLSGRAGGAAHDELPFDQRDRRAGRPGDARCGSRRRPAPWGGGALCALRRHRGGARGGERGHRAVACLWAAHLGSHREIGLPRRPLRWPLIARDHDLTLLTDETDAYPGGIVVSSVRLAKGLEFDEAVLLDADGRRYATEADRNLLYVAVTRAMHALTVLYRDEPLRFWGRSGRVRPSAGGQADRFYCPSPISASVTRQQPQEAASARQASVKPLFEKRNSRCSSALPIRVLYSHDYNKRNYTKLVPLVQENRPQHLPGMRRCRSSF